MDTTLQHQLTSRLARTVIRWKFMAPLALIISFGAIIRLVALDRFPPGLHFDEAVYGLLARDILHGARPVFFSAWTGREPLYMYLMAPVQAVVGVNTLAIRLTSALTGIATLPLTYLLGRALFNRRVAWLAAGLIAVNYWHLTVSRNGYPNILIPPLEALSFYFLWRSYQSEVHIPSLDNLGATESPDYPQSESVHPLRQRQSGDNPSAYPLRQRQSADRPSVNPLRRRQSADRPSVNPLRRRQSADRPSAYPLRRRQSADRPSANPFRRRQSADRPSAYPLRRRQSADRPSAYPLLSAALGGLFAGLVLYTYLAARFYPITLLAIAVYAFIVDRQRFTRQLPTLAVSVLAMVIVAAPLAVHFIRTPHDFLERAGQVLIVTRASSASEGVRLFLANVGQTALGFFVRGDPRWHYNLPGKPVFDPLIAIFFLAGMLIALRRRREIPCAAVLIWTAVMCLPGILTADLQPATQRMFGVFPALVMLPALGLDEAWRWMSHRRPKLVPLALAGLVLLFIWEGVSTTRTYFGDWVRRYETYEIFNGDYVQMAGVARHEMALRQDSDEAGGHTVVFVSEHYKHPTLAYLAPETVDDAVWTLGEHGLVFPAPRTANLSRGDTGEAVYLVPRESFPPGSRVDRVLRERASSVETVDGFAGRPAFTVYRVRQAPARRPLSRPAFNSEVAFIDAEWPAAVARDGQVPVTVRWQVIRPVPQARTFSLHLTDGQGLRWAQKDEMSYLSEQWRSGDEVEQWFALPVDPTTPAGTYSLQLALADDEAHPLPVLGEDGVPAGVWLNLGDVTLMEAGGRIEEIGRGTPMGASLQALDHSRADGPVTPGTRLTMSVLWQKTDASAADQTVQIEFIADAGQPWLVVEQPVAGQYPPSAWQARTEDGRSVGEIVRAQYAVRLPADAPAGISRVRLRRGEATLDLGQIDVQAEGRLFTVPEVQTPLRARFGDGIQFLGYDLPETASAPGDVVSLTLFWQALHPVEGDYKVFTHLLDPTGQVRGQKDSVPVGGTRPTAGWAEGEIIIDKYEIPLLPDAPAGTYQIEIGLYDAATLVRLPAFDAGGVPVTDDRLLLPHSVQVER